MKALVALGLAAYATAEPMHLAAQVRDSARTLEPMVITAERSPNTLLSAAASVTRIDAAQLARLPYATVADVLRLSPGFALVDFDGLGFDPQLMVRGFYGGGEAAYVVVMVDGQPLNEMQRGLVAWDALPPLESIDAIEIVRGSASALYGDAAIGGVINIITREPASMPPRWSLAAGSHETWRANATLGGELAWRDASLSMGLDRTSGFREHAQRTAGRVDARLTLAASGASRVVLTTRSHWRKFEDPGALLDSLFARDRSASDPFFRFDETRDRDHAVRVYGERVSASSRLSGSIGGEHRVTDAVRTIPLAPDFSDTKARDLTTSRASGNVQFDVSGTPLPGADQVTIGADLGRGWSASEYFAVWSGDRGTYALASGDRGPIESTGDATRNSAALYAQYALQVTSAARFSLGGRFDWLSDDFESRSARNEDPVSASHAAFSPKVGLNVRYHERSRAMGNAYFTASRSFKAPTLDQLFDQRTIPIPFPPFSATTSNALLAPQYGVNVEGGVYHRAAIAERAMLAATISAYQMDMKDEIDFDVAALRYVNIGRSRHRGIEAGLTLTGVGASAVWLNHTVQSASARSGDFAGRALKAIPKHVTTAGVSVSPFAPIEVRAVVTHTRAIFLDDANSVELPAYTRADAAVAFRLRSLELFVDAKNLLGARYSSTGFLDPSGSGAIFFHPAAGRVVQLGIRSGR